MTEKEESLREELAELNKHFAYCSLGDRPPSPAASKLRRAAEIEEELSRMRDLRHVCDKAEKCIGSLDRREEVLSNLKEIFYRGSCPLVTFIARLVNTLNFKESESDYYYEKWQKQVMRAQRAERELDEARARLRERDDS